MISKKLILLILAWGYTLTAHCKELKTFEERLHKAQTEAEQTTQHIAQLLIEGKLDSLPHQSYTPSETLYLVFGNGELFFWSDNWLVVNDLHKLPYGDWHYQEFENAHCIVKWQGVGVFDIFAIMPIKYTYIIENKYLQNNFADYLKLDSKWDLIYNPTDEIGRKFYNKEGNYLFSIIKQKKKKTTTHINTKAVQTFSYTPLLETENNTIERISNISHNTIRFYAYLFLIPLIIYLGWFLFMLYKHKGFANLRINYKFQVVFSFIIFVGFFIVLLATMDYIRKNYERRQRFLLQEKALYIQKALQDTYFWNTHLSRHNTTSLNVYLKDLSYTYKTDIHVYDIYGHLIGSSQPALFDLGLLSHRISPRPFFNKNTNIIQEEKIGQLHYISAYSDLVNGDYSVIGYIAVPFFISSNLIKAQINSLLAILIPIYMTIMLASILLTFFISKKITNPIITMGEKLKKLKIDQHNEKIIYHQQDEIGLLVEQYNQMVDEVEQSTALLAQQEREEAWKTMARQVAHEIKNPLTPMKLSIQQLQRMQKIQPENFEEHFKKATHLLIEQIDNLTLIANEFSYFAKMPATQVEEVDMATKAQTSIELFRTEVENRIQINYHGKPSDVWAMSDEKLILQVFNNLIKNAIQALNKKTNGQIDITIEEHPETILIKVADNGPGIPDEIKDQVFVPNFTTKSTGMGMGLVITKKIVEDSGGIIHFTSSEQGTCFFLEFIRASTPAQHICEQKED
jgi:signal transduction histidine kinase